VPGAVARLVRRVLEPELLAPLVVAAALFILSGVFNVLYTCLHDAEQCAAVHSRVGPVPSDSLQNTTEIILSFMAYAMMTYGIYSLRNALARTRRSSLAIATGLALVIMGALLLAVMFAAKR